MLRGQGGPGESPSEAGEVPMAMLPLRGIQRIHPKVRPPMLLTALLVAACSGDVSGPRVIEEMPPDELAELVYRIDVEPASDTLRVGETVELQALARVRTEDGEEAVVQDASFFTWASKDTAVAVVDAAGLVLAKAAGEAQIVASAGSFQGAATVVVVGGGDEPGPEPEPGSSAIEVTPDSVVLVVGDELQLTVTSEDSIPDGAIEWTSSNDGVATVDSNGRVKARGEGVASVKATYGTQSDSAMIYVESPPVAGPAPGLIPAFPGAEGFGALAFNNCDRRNLEVREVTNLENGGPGSLRHAIENSDPSKFTVVVFRTGGTIVLSRHILFNKPCIYVAGQTAPGDGIQLRGPENENHKATMLKFPNDRSGHDVVIRYLRVRAGRGKADASDNIWIQSGYNIVLDHLSVAWGNDEGVSISPVRVSAGGKEADHITIQNSIIAATLHPHAVGSIIGGSADEPDVSNISIHHNVYANNSHRNPLIRRVKCAEVVNNVIYNWRSRAASSFGDTCIDYVGNYYKKGPGSGTDVLRHTYEGTGEDADPKLYMVGNVLNPGQMDPNANQSNLIKYFGGKSGPLPASAFVKNKQAKPTFPIRYVTSAVAAFDEILANAGANKRLTCDGRWVDARDKTDDLIISQVRNNTGPAEKEQSDHHDDYGGFPNLSRGTPCVDSDGDGMPDEYEKKYGLNPYSASDAALDADGNGYINLEEYLAGRPPR